MPLAGVNQSAHVICNITQTSGNVITAAGLQLLGSGTVTLNDAGNNVATLAANYNGPIGYTDANTLTIGTVTDGPSGMTASGSSEERRVGKERGPGWGPGQCDEMSKAQAITLGLENVTLIVTSKMTETRRNVLPAAGLQLLGSGSVTLNDGGNNVSTLAANYNGPIGYTDANSLTIGTVTDGPSGMTASG